MEMYKKPVMNIIEMENVDVLTESTYTGYCNTCGYKYKDASKHDTHEVTQN